MDLGGGRKSLYISININLINYWTILFKPNVVEITKNTIKRKKN